MRLLLCTALLTARAQTAAARGFVVDAANGQPLQGVNVVLLEGTVLLKGTATDGNGYFILTGAPPRSPPCVSRSLSR